VQVYERTCAYTAKRACTGTLLLLHPEYRAEISSIRTCSLCCDSPDEIIHYARYYCGQASKMLNVDRGVHNPPLILSSSAGLIGYSQGSHWLKKVGVYAVLVPPRTGVMTHRLKGKKGERK